MTAAPAWAVFAVGAAIALPFYVFGLAALDQSYIFDAAGRLCSGQALPGQVSFPFGHVPIFIQAALFKVFGISWHVYGAHAALANGCWVLLCHSLLFGGRARQAMHWAWPLAGASVLLCASLSLYCLLATPFGESHSALFVGAALWAAVRGGTLKQPVQGLLIGAFLALALLSKQSPAIFLMPFVGLAALLSFKTHWRLTAFAALGFVLPFLLLHVYMAAGQGSHMALGYWQGMLSQARGTGKSRLATPYFWGKIDISLATPRWDLRLYPLLAVAGLAAAWQQKQLVLWRLQLVAAACVSACVSAFVLAFVLAFACANASFQYFLPLTYLGLISMLGCLATWRQADSWLAVGFCVLALAMARDAITLLKQSVYRIATNIYFDPVHDFAHYNPTVGLFWQQKTDDRANYFGLLSQ